MLNRTVQRDRLLEYVWGQSSCILYLFDCRPCTQTVSTMGFKHTGVFRAPCCQDRDGKGLLECT